MEVTVVCHQCGSQLPVEATDTSLQINCGGCKQAFMLGFSDAVRADEKVDQCPVCQGGDFYMRKDFDPKIGLAVIVIAALISAGFYYYGMDLVAYGVLGGAALIDLAVFSRLKDLTICYRCHAEFRGTYEQTANPFDLHTADELEQEYERKIGKR